MNLASCRNLIISTDSADEPKERVVLPLGQSPLFATTRKSGVRFISAEKRGVLPMTKRAGGQDFLE
jgi:hypothetical protein